MLTLFSRQGAGIYQHQDFPDLESAARFVNTPIDDSGTPFEEGCELFALDEDAEKIYWMDGLYTSEGFNEDFDDTEPVRFALVSEEFHEEELKIFQQFKNRKQSRAFCTECQTEFTDDGKSDALQQFAQHRADFHGGR